MKLITESDIIPENFTGIVEYTNGDKEWYLNGKLHRESGPAIECAYGTKFWYLNDIEYTESKYKAKLSKSKSKCNKKIVTIKGKRYKLVPV